MPQKLIGSGSITHISIGGKEIGMRNRTSNGKTGMVLIVDAEKRQTDKYECSLRQRHIPYQVAHSTKDALRIFDLYYSHDHRKEICVIVVDGIIGAEDGAGFVRHVRQSLEFDGCIIAASGEGYADRMLNAGCNFTTRKHNAITLAEDHRTLEIAKRKGD